jgi:hypothetical protein
LDERPLKKAAWNKNGATIKSQRHKKFARGKRPRQNYFFSYHSAFIAVNFCHFSGRSSSAKIAVTGQTGTQAPQSMHSTGLMYNIVSVWKAGSSLRGWMQSTGHTSTQAVSLVLMQGSAIT